MLCWGRVSSVLGERELLVTLLAALADPSAAARLPGAPPDSTALLNLARHHRLTPLLSAERGTELPAALAQAFRKDRIVTTARNVVFARVAEECLAALSAAGVPGMVLKGVDYDSRLYPVPGSRATSDVDLLVPISARRDAFRVLDRLGFEPRAAAPGFDESDYHEVAWRRAGVEVDLHTGLAPFVRCRIDYDAVWREAEIVRLGSTEARRLAGPHAAVFHALHMAIDHFGIPAIYLIDLARLLPTPADRARAESVAVAWRCARPLDTATWLTAAFIPDWAAAPRGRPGMAARRVVAGYGTSAPLPRPEQLFRKLLHFDTASYAARYLAVQARRNVRELFEKRMRRRTARNRLQM